MTDTVHTESGHQIERFRQMRWQAKYHAKSVPSMDELCSLLPLDMRCPICARLMNWKASEGRSTVITLQHDRAGGHRLICHACNSRHAKMVLDSFYDVPVGHKYCPKCKETKPLSEFWKDRSGDRWLDTYTYCKPCTAVNRRRWATENRDHVNSKRRAYYHARKVAGNPIARGRAS